MEYLQFVYEHWIKTALFLMLIASIFPAVAIFNKK